MTYASETSVPVSKSRQAIGSLLQAWGCRAISWSDDFDTRVVRLRFVWEHAPGVELAARLELRLSSEADARDSFARTPTQRQVERRMAQQDRAAHRLILLKLKADLHAVEAGLLTALEVFMPMLEDASGRTVSEAITPLITSGAVLLHGETR